jgi:hypothetical protein
VTTGLVQTNAIAGPFTLAYTPPGGSSASLGVIGGEGIRIMRSISGEPITGDQYGRETILDGVYTGGNIYLEFLLQEANRTAVKAMAYPFNETTTSGSTSSLERELGTPGLLFSSAAGALVATPVAGTKAASESTPTRTFGLVVAAMGHTIDTFMRAGLKTFPMRLLCIPYLDGGNKTVWFTQT